MMWQKMSLIYQNGKLNQKDNKKNSESFSGILSQHCIKDKQIEAKGVKYIAQNNPNPSL